MTRRISVSFECDICEKAQELGNVAGVEDTLPLGWLYFWISRGYTRHDKSPVHYGSTQMLICNECYPIKRHIDDDKPIHVKIWKRLQRFLKEGK